MLKKLESGPELILGGPSEAPPRAERRGAADKFDRIIHGAGLSLAALEVGEKVE